MMKKLLSCLLLTILSISMAGCGDGSSSSSTSTSGAPTLGSSSALIKAAYVDTTAPGAYAAIPSAGFSIPNIIIFTFADVTTSSMSPNLVSSIEKAMSSESAGTLNLLSLGGQYANSATFNSGSVNTIASNVISQINGFNSTHSTKIGGVDLDLEGSIDSNTIASLATAFKNAGFIVSAAPQVYISGGTNIDSSKPSNLVLTSGGNVNTYQAALNTGKIDYLFVQTYNTGGFTIDNVDESNVHFFKNAAQALNNVVQTSCSSTAICIPASTKIVIGTVANKYAGGFTPFANNATAADQQSTLNTLLSDINSMAGNPAFSYFAGTMVWSQNMDYAASLYSSGNTAQTPGAFNTTIFGGAPAPTVPYFIVQISNNAPNAPNNNAYGSVTLVVNGTYYQFPNQYNQPITPQLNQQWGTLPSSQSTPGVVDSQNLDSLFNTGATSFTASNVLVYGYQNNASLNNPSGTYFCRSNSSYTFNAGRSYNVIFNATDNTGNNGTAACVINQVN
jgi:hypothetical protein